MIMTAPLRLPFKVYSVASAVDRKLPFKLSWIKKAQKSEQHEAEAEKARIQVQKEAEGCRKQMLAVTGSTGSIERSFAAVTAAHYRQIGFMVSHNANAD